MGRADGSALLYCSAFNLVPHGLPYRGVYPPSSSCGAESQCWAAHTVVGRPTTVFAPLRRRVVLNVHIGLPCCDVRIPSSSSGVERRHWTAHIVVGSPAAMFVSPRRCWAAYVVVGSPSATFVSPRCRPVSNVGVGLLYRGVASPLVVVLWDLGVVVGMVESGDWRY